VPWREVLSRTLQALDHPIPPEVVGEAPCQEIDHELDLRRLPVPTWFEHESGAYITAGVIVARDPESGRRNVSIARVQVRGARTAFVGIAPNHHLSVFARRAAALGRKLEVAVTIGQHPAVVLASNLYLRPGDDEFDNAGALLGRGLEALERRRPLVLDRLVDPAERVQALSVGDAEHPGRELARALEVADLVPHHHHRIVQHLFNELRALYEIAHEPAQARLIDSVQLLERVRVVRLHTLKQLVFSERA